MKDYFKYRSLLIIFACSILILGCSFNFSVGNKITAGEAETLATKTLQNFNRSIQQGDFEQFHQTEIAPSLKNELTTEKLNTAFAPFTSRKIDIRPKDGTKINFSSPPAIDGQYLNLNGGYPAQSGKNISFKLQYVKETGEWKLKYIDINIS